tara:strand:+ start:1287 stop:1691 length:405 start_codon:yes stop_codon:yes gene_type:complete
MGWSNIYDQILGVMYQSFGFVMGVPTVMLVLFVLSSAFMMMAWYGHLRLKHIPLWQAIGLSWFIAFLQFALHIPANRIGYSSLSLAELKLIQEAVALIAFIGFTVFYLKEKIKPREWLGFVFVFIAVILIFYEI